jgi:hypothetical protein
MPDNVRVSVVAVVRGASPSAEALTSAVAVADPAETPSISIPVNSLCPLPVLRISADPHPAIDAAIRTVAKQLPRLLISLRCISSRSSPQLGSCADRLTQDRMVNRITGASVRSSTLSGMSKLAIKGNIFWKPTGALRRTPILLSRSRLARPCANTCNPIVEFKFLLSGFSLVRVEMGQPYR